MYNDTLLDRKDRLKGAGKVELPLSIDTNKYLVGNLSFRDLFTISPFLIFSLISILVLYGLDMLSRNTAIICAIPTLIIGTLQLIKHPIRKNLAFLQYGVIWKIKFKQRNKEFHYKKGEMDMANTNDQDTRKKLGIRNIYSGCYETTDDYFVKVLECSSINMSLMNNNEKSAIYDSYRSFLSESFTKSLQLSQIAQPVNLSQYLLFIDRETENEQDIAKRQLVKSYKRYIESIQKSKNMVSRKTYVIVKQKISSDREKSLSDLERNANITKTNLENMLRGYEALEVTILQNDELLKLMYTCVDYDSAQSLGNHVVARANNKVSISLGENSARDIIASLEKQLEENIN